MTSTLADLRVALRRDHRLEEAEAVLRLRPLQADTAQCRSVTERALELARQVRAAPLRALGAESFLRQHGLSTREGVALMCVAEALLRIPDEETQDALLRDKLAGGAWGEATEASLLSNAAEWALLLTGTIARWHDATEEPAAPLKRLVARLGEPVVRLAVRQAMRILAEQFVFAETIDAAVLRARQRRPFLFSFDMLGEAARSAQDAARYFDSYAGAVTSIAAPDSVSIKLSALHPRFEEAKRARLFTELLPKLRELARLAAGRNVTLTIDAEESERLELTLDLFEALATKQAGEQTVGLAVQAYQKRALAVCDWLIALGRQAQRRIPVRLVKGAYWDSEVKRAQQLGMPDYPVFTRKAATDLSYMACAARLLAEPAAIYPAFATHNCRTVAGILELAGEREFEFQKLLGMGDALYEALPEARRAPCRVYAPVGRFNELLPYLVRRLLENGANTSFVHQIADPSVAPETLVADPAAALPEPYAPDARIPLPRDLYPDRRNSSGLDLARRDVLDALQQRVREDGALPEIAPTPAPALEAAMARAVQAFETWSREPAESRAVALERAGDAIEIALPELTSLIVREGGRCYVDAVAEVREAADFCRYYALEARRVFTPTLLAGPAGERNELLLQGRGVFACISPWNFPLAIFIGQAAAALAAGNAVIAKPAEQTPRVAMRAISILHQAGIPPEVAFCAVGDGDTIGARLVADERIAGVAFTGSTATAKRIHAALAARAGPIVPLIAETGGVNAMLVDASALPEQVVDDILISAFNSAGQRCSALRVLFVDEACAPRVLALLAGALAELQVGDSAEPETDVGPVIDPAAQAALLSHIHRLRATAELIGESRLAAGLRGNYVAPVAFALPLQALPLSEVFGPVLHVCRYPRKDFDQVLQWIRASGYGLTLGIHSRIQGTIDHVLREARVGNIYVNRNMVGAVVGVQPFGGSGLSGTGPKAGGPHYLPRFATERTVTVNTAAIGGVTELLTRA